MCLLCLRVHGNDDGNSGSGGGGGAAATACAFTVYELCRLSLSQSYWIYMSKKKNMRN